MIRKNRKLFLITGGIFLTILALPVVFWGGVHLYNNLKILQFENRLRQIPLPPGAEVISSNTDFGVISGSSNYCGAIARILISTEKSSIDFSRYETAVFALAGPFTPLQFIDIIQYDQGRLFLIYKGNRFPITKNGYIDWSQYTGPEHVAFALNRRERAGIQNLIEKIAGGKNSKNHYILIVNDQTYSGISFNDLRCH